MGKCLRGGEGGDGFGDGVGVGGGHQVGAGDAGDRCQFVQQLGADVDAFAARIGGLVEALDQCLGDDRAIEPLAHPPRRARRSQGGKTDQDFEAAR